MASSGNFSDGSLPAPFSITGFVEYHARQAEARWNGEGRVALSAQILMVQVLETIPIGFFRTRDGEPAQAPGIFGQIDEQFPAFLNQMLERGAFAPSVLGPPQ